MRLKSLGNLAHTNLVCGNPLHTTYAEIQRATKVALRLQSHISLFQALKTSYNRSSGDVLARPIQSDLL